MPPLQPYVPNVPLQVSKNLRFTDPNGIPVTEMLPIGMNGNVVADSPTTGYISRIGAKLSDQIDLYNQVAQTLNTYGTDISELQAAVAALEVSGTTLPDVNGSCFNGNLPIRLDLAVQAMIDQACLFYPVMGTPTDLTNAILAENPTVLNVAPAFSQDSAMAGLSGWISDPRTVAASINNLWLSYLDSRAGLSKLLSLLRPTCSEAIIDFLPVYNSYGPPAGFAIYFSGYSFIPSAYEDAGSTVTITDGIGGVFTTAIDMVAASQPGADPLFVGISGTPLSPTVPSYTVTLNSVIVSGAYNCTKTVIHSTPSASSTGSACCPDIGNYAGAVTSGDTSVPLITGLSYTPRYIQWVPKSGAIATALKNAVPYPVYTAGGATLNFVNAIGVTGTLNIDWIAYR